MPRSWTILDERSTSGPEFTDYGVCPFYESIATRLRPLLQVQRLERTSECSGRRPVHFLRHIMRQLTLPHSIGRIPTAITDRILPVITSQAHSADTIFFFLSSFGNEEKKMIRAFIAYLAHSRVTRNAGVNK